LVDSVKCVYPICNVCGNPSLHVALPDAVPSISGAHQLSCSQLEYKGLQGSLPPHTCSLLAASDIPQQCGCKPMAKIATTWRLLTAAATSNAIPSKPVARPLLLPTRRPTIHPHAPVKAALPTLPPMNIDPICYVCGNSSRQITKPNAMATIPGDIISCSQLQYQGLNHFLDISACELLPSLNPPPFCGCSPIPPKPSPPTIAMRRPTVKPLVHTSRPIVAMPLPSPGYPICYICGNETLHVTKPNATALIGSSPNLCSNLEYAGLHGYIQGGYCEIFVYQFKVPLACGCAPIPPSTTPPPPTVVTSSSRPTFKPTSPHLVPTTVRPVAVTPSVKPQPSPGYPVCYICGNSTQHVTKPNVIITIGGTTCSILEHGGLSGFILAQYCETLPVFQIPSKCGCAPISPPPSATVVTTRPASRPAPLPTVRPTAKPSL
jgi:hypothetical protein